MDQQRRSGFNPAGPLGRPIDSIKATATHEDGKRQLDRMKLTRVVSAARGDGNEEDRDRLLANYETFLTSLIATRSEKSERDRKRHEVLWTACLLYFDDNFDQEKVWYKETVEQWAPVYLLWLFDHTKPLPGRPCLKASTVDGWSKRLIENILHFTWDPVLGKKAGMTVLTVGGLFHKLHEIVHNVIMQNALERTMNQKHYYGRPEVQRLIEVILGSGRHRRRGAIQIILKLIFGMILALRPSSIGPANDLLASLGRFLKLRHLKVYRAPGGGFAFVIRLCIDNLKASRPISTLPNADSWRQMSLTTVEAEELVFMLESVLNGVNVLFDPTMWMILWLFIRGALPYDSLHELSKGEEAEIEIKKEMLDEPLFVIIEKGMPTTKVAKAGSATQAVTYYAHKAGLPGGGMGTLRREAGDKFAVQLGERVARDVLNHATEGVFRRHYSRNVAHYDLTRIRLGELPGPEEKFAGEKLQAALGKFTYLEFAVEAMVRQTQAAEDATADVGVRISGVKTTLEKQQGSSTPLVSIDMQAQCNKDAEADPGVVAALAARTRVFDQVYGYFWYDTTAPRCTTGTIRIAQRSVKTRYADNPNGIGRLQEAADDAKDPIQWLHVLTSTQLEEFEALKAVCKQRHEDYTKMKQKVRKQLKQALEKKAMRELSGTTLSGTVSEREKALADVQKPHPILYTALGIAQDARMDATMEDPPTKGATLEEAPVEDATMEDAAAQTSVEGPSFIEALDAPNALARLNTKPTDDQLTEWATALAHEEDGEVDTRGGSISKYLTNVIPAPVGGKGGVETVVTEKEHDSKLMADMMYMRIEHPGDEDPFKHVAVSELRYAMCLALYQPIEDEGRLCEDMSKLVATARDVAEGKAHVVGHYKCTDCFTAGGEVPKLAGTRRWNRHQCLRHSTYARLIRCDEGGEYRCPAGDFSTSSANTLRCHLTSSACSESHEHRRLLRLHFEHLVLYYNVRREAERWMAGIKDIAEGGDGLQGFSSREKHGSTAGGAKMGMGPDVDSGSDEEVETDDEDSPEKGEDAGWAPFQDGFVLEDVNDEFEMDDATSRMRVLIDKMVSSVVLPADEAAGVAEIIGFMKQFGLD
ncbi:hypothetical protein DFH09DRAFT_1416443 [Mycena vulgaris]|nr:hypothetical protein DFH09DRAFT_1416443 [Mycena vulgaris]